MNSPTITDSIRIDMLDNLSRSPGGVLLHCGSAGDGIALDMRGRTIREAIDYAFGATSPRFVSMPLVMLTQAKLESALASFVLVKKADLLPDTKGEAASDIARLERLAAELTTSLWSSLGGGSL